MYAYGVSTRLSTPTCNHGLVEMVARLVDRVRSKIQLFNTSKDTVVNMAMR